MLARAPPRVFSGTTPRSAVQGAARLRATARADAAVLVGAARGRAIRISADQVVGLPEAVDVALAEPDAAVQRPAPGGRVVDADGRVEVGAGLAVGAAAAVLDDLDLAAAGAAEDGADGGARGCVLHGEGTLGPLGVRVVAGALQLQPRRLDVDLGDHLQRHRRIAGEQAEQQRAGELAAAGGRASRRRSSGGRSATSVAVPPLARPPRRSGARLDVDLRGARRASPARKAVRLIHPHQGRDVVALLELDRPTPCPRDLPVPVRRRVAPPRGCSRPRRRQPRPADRWGRSSSRS